MHIEWSEEKFLKGSVGHQIKLCLWNKLQMTDRLLMQLASYRYVLTRIIWYQTYVLIDFIYLPTFLVLFFDTSILFYTFYCSTPAAWIKVLSFGVCFKSVASFCHPQYLLRTSPRSIPYAWNSRIWHFHLNNTLLPRRNVWNLVFATSKPESMKLTCQFRRCLARTFRPVMRIGNKFDCVEGVTMLRILKMLMLAAWMWATLNLHVRRNPKFCHRGTLFLDWTLGWT